MQPFNNFILAILLLTLSLNANAQSLNPPSDLRVDLLLNTDKVWKNGLPVAVSLQQAKQSTISYQMARIPNQTPYFSWVINDHLEGSFQTAYRILVASSAENLKANKGDFWDSGKVIKSQQTGIIYNGRKLNPNTVYYWKVRTWNNKQTASDFSQASSFITESTLKPYQAAHQPLVKSLQKPVFSKQLNSLSTLYDFGKDAFGLLKMRISSLSDGDTMLVHIGEAIDSLRRVDRKPRGTIRYRLIKLPLLKGEHSYDLKFLADERNTGSKAILMPDYIGEVLPFRYVELEKNDKVVIEVQRYVVNYPFNDQASSFKSSDTLLNKIWDLSKHTIKATSFTGLYVDGDRERIPYEADALINQLSHYASDAEFNMAKRSLDYLIYHATWPTEWSLQNLLVAWNDYLYSGDIRTVQLLYPQLKPKLLLALARPDGLISTKTGKQDSSFTKSIHFSTFNGETVLKDIVDWPQKGGFGLPPSYPGETDGFVFTNYNAVVNAFHYQALICMKDLAEALGEKEDAIFYTQLAKKVKQAFQHSFINPTTGTVKDGEDTMHSSLHANMLALAFNLVPNVNKASVIAHIRTRGMACSVYGAQFLLDALYDANEAEYGLQLLTSTDKRSWYNMLRSGSTMTTEAWDTDYKNNQDWNHAWGAAPANIIVRKLMGVEPLSPAFGVIQIKPQPGTLNSAELQLSTLHGKIKIAFNKTPKQFQLKVSIPPNTKGLVYLPRQTESDRILMNEKPLTTTQDGKFWVIRDVKSGTHTWQVRYQ
ncbi:alpha-L-rhamnosidase C-terminal domain-containing protein [Pedobacter foliorum]|uniref:alpha-L-rhamnosidase-related protein n=1 Tax=Pedobacter foliorum TaxID=2739058 RepID=UPI001564C12A|nr:alpha-L-rhamnosidase C-terminal domain-containing protein [Pedobacter foliorum]NRF39299.1 alpha-L-rhamnosidase [Pedobacter foliorum]